MKRIAILIAALLCTMGLFAQTPEEIVQKMKAEMDRGDTEGFSMNFNMKIPIIGTVYSHNLVLGDKMKSEITGMDKTSVSWSDATTKWTYKSETGEITIEDKTSSGSGNSGSPDTGIVFPIVAVAAIMASAGALTAASRKKKN